MLRRQETKPTDILIKCSDEKLKKQHTSKDQFHVLQNDHYFHKDQTKLMRFP